MYRFLAKKTTGMVVGCWAISVGCLWPCTLVAQPCLTPGEVVYPLNEMMLSSVARMELSFTYGKKSQLPFAKSMAKYLTQNLSAENDARLLALLLHKSRSTLPMLTLSTDVGAGLFSDYMQVLKRHDLQRAYNALQQTRQAYPNWWTTRQARYDQWSDGRGRILNAQLDRLLRQASDLFVSARGSITEKIDALIRSDPKLLARVEQSHAQRTTDDEHLSFVSDRVATCMAQSPAQELAPALRDVYISMGFLYQAWNGGAHQYFFNSEGAEAPQFVAILKRLQLHEEAADMHAAMALLGDVYPQDTQSRRRFIAQLNDAQDNALNQPTYIADEGKLWDALIVQLKQADYWPG